MTLDICLTGANKHKSTHTNTPGKEDAFHHIEVLHQHISLRLGAEIANGISNTQLDGPLQGRGGGLEAESREKNKRARCGWKVYGKIVMCSKPTASLKSNRKDKKREISKGKAHFLVCSLPRGIHPSVADLFLMGRAHSEWGRHLSQEQKRINANLAVN